MSKFKDFITSANCLYTGKNDFNGYTVTTVKSSAHKRDFAWEYISKSFYEPVIDFLNNDYSRLIGYGDTFNDDNSIEYATKSLNRKNDITLVIEDLSPLEKSDIREMVDAVLLFDNASNTLSCAQKWGIFSYLYPSKAIDMLTYESKSYVSFETPNYKECDAKVELLQTKGNLDFLNLSKLIRKDNLRFELATQHIFESLSGMMKFLIAEMIRLDVSIKKCRNCGRYFVPFRSDALYCSGQSSQDNNKTCQEYGKYAAYLKKTRTDDATRLYKQVYNIKNNKLRRCGGGNTILYKDLKDFIETANTWKAEVKDGTKNMGEFLAWLYEIKEKTVENKKGVE